MKKLLLGIMALMLLAACDGKSKDGTIERATTEQEAARDVDNKNLAQKAQQLETYLGVQHNLYKAVEGEYDGTVMVNRSPAKMRLTFTRTIQEFKGGRTRQLSEIETDINSLRFNVQARQWHPKYPGSAVGCNYTLVKPDYNQGFIELQPASASSECKLTYRIYLSNAGMSDSELRDMDPTSPRWSEIRGNAQGVAGRLNSGDVSPVTELLGAVQSTFGEAPFNFDVKRIR